MDFVYAGRRIHTAPSMDRFIRTCGELRGGLVPSGINLLGEDRSGYRHDH